MEMPLMGFGTYGRTGPDGLEALLFALETGYRHLDTAQDYGTEENCGRAVAQSGLPRDAVFVTTKIATGNLGPGKVIPSLERSLEELKMDYVDLALIHWPSPYGKIAPEIYLEQLGAVRQAGLARNIGVSNFTIALLNTAEKVLGRGALLTNQVEANVFIQNQKLLDHCLDMGLVPTCYQPIAGGAVEQDEAFAAYARTKGVSPSTLALAFLIEQGYAVIPTSSNHSRIAQNFKANGVRLDCVTLEQIRKFDKNSRRIDPDWGPEWD